MPKVSIILPVYNGEKYLKEAINSILCQTLSDFILIIINDCSTDNSLEVINSFNDPRIKILNNKENIGLANTLNLGLKNSNTKYIARMDQDDISLPDRIKKQVDFMDANPEIGVCGTYTEVFNNDSARLKKFPLKHDDIKIALIFNSPLAHPTVMMRKEIFNKFNFQYDSNFDGAEDYDLWERMSSCVKLENIPEPLLRYRIHANQLSRIAPEKQKKIDRIRSRAYATLNIKKNKLWKLLKANKKYHIYNQKNLRKKVWNVYFDDFKTFLKNIIKKVF